MSYLTRISALGPPEQASASPPVPAQSVRWDDWPRYQIRRAFVQFLRTQTVQISVGATTTLVHAKPPPRLSKPVLSGLIGDSPGQNGLPAMLVLPPPHQWKLFFMGFLNRSFNKRLTF